MFILFSDPKLVYKFYHIFVFLSIIYVLGDFLSTKKVYLPSYAPDEVIKNAESNGLTVLKIMQHKGNVHLNIGKPLTTEEIAAAAQCDKNDRYQWIRHAVDKRVIEGYRLWKNNYVAYDLLNQSDKYAHMYDSVDVESFTAYMQKQLDTVEPELDRDELRKAFLDIYANPVVTRELLEKEKATGEICL